MTRIFKFAVLTFVGFAAFAADVALKMVLGFVVAGPFMLLFPQSKWPVVCGVLLGFLLNGLWECCDTFGIRRLAERILGDESN